VSMSHNITIECGGTTDDEVTVSVEPDDEDGWQKWKQMWREREEILTFRIEFSNLLAVIEA